VPHVVLIFIPPFFATFFYVPQLGEASHFASTSGLFLEPPRCLPPFLTPMPSDAGSSKGAT